MALSQDFYAYKEELESRGGYTLPSEDEIASYDEMAIPPKTFSLEKAKKHPFTWSYHVIGIKPRDYQFKMLNDMMLYGRLVGCTSRQIGKSTSIGLFSFWAAYNNIYPSGPQKDTKILIVSHTEQAAKDLLKTIDGLITMADARMAQFSKHSRAFQPNYFRSRIKSQNQFEIKFARGSIKVYPPTGKVRGNSADVLIIDEASNLHCQDPDYFFASEAKPTTTATNGKVILFSTPKGQSGFFHDIMQPSDNTPLEGWSRIWMPWTIISNEDILESIWEERQRYILAGSELDFKIEYEASFLSGKHSFFHPEHVDNCIDYDMDMQFSYNSPVTVGIDFGDTHSRTVVFIVDYDRKQNRVTTIWHKEFPQGYNNANLPDFIDELRTRYLIDKLVVDDCVGGATAIEMLRQRGYKIERFNFTTSKAEYYEYLRNSFSNGNIVLYNSPALINQIKAMETYETQAGRTVIRKPSGGRDDMVDALMLAASPYITVKRQTGWRFANFASTKRRPRVHIRPEGKND